MSDKRSKAGVSNYFVAWGAQLQFHFKIEQPRGEGGNMSGVQISINYTVYPN
jgi:hypothetical protein